MNILILTTHLNSGGITSYLKTLSGGLIHSGNRVWIVSSGGNRVDEFTRIGIQSVILNIRTKSELDPRIYWPLGRLARLIREEKINVIHAHTRITQVMGQCLGKMTGRPFVSTCHGFFKTRLSRRLVPCWGDAVIAISPAVKEHLEKDFRVPASRVFLVKNGIDIKDFPLSSPEMKKQKRREVNVPLDGPVIGIIARLSDVKGHDVLIHAMPRVLEKIPKAVLMIVGEGRLEACLKKQVEDLALNDHVVFNPTVNRTSEYLGLFDIFVMPSLQEGLGLAVIEAQAAGLPVVASRVGGIPSLIENGKTGLMVEPGNSQGLAEAMIEVLEDRQRAQEMGRCAREFIEQEFTADKMVEQTLEVYRGLL